MLIIKLKIVKCVDDIYGTDFLFRIVLLKKMSSFFLKFT